MEISNYSTMKVAELKKLLLERNIQGRSYLTKKSEMIFALNTFDVVRRGEEKGEWEEGEDEDYIFEENLDLEEYNEEEDRNEDGSQDWEISKEEYERLMEESELSLDDVMEKYK
jgi:hypothetical protein